MCFVDNEGNILVPKTVRPVIEYEPTILGEKKDQKTIQAWEFAHTRI
jgi:hypothetical protein